jgi:hypothetical protein
MGYNSRTTISILLRCEADKKEGRDELLHALRKVYKTSNNF